MFIKIFSIIRVTFHLKKFFSLQLSVFFHISQKYKMKKIYIFNKTCLVKKCNLSVSPRLDHRSFNIPENHLVKFDKISK